jgi:hypothetical protein
MPIMEQDAASQLSCQYLDALAKHLKPEQLDNGEVEIPNDRFTPTTVSKLADDLRSAIEGNAGFM